MPRPRQFDTEQVIEKAMRVFWAKGYEATSLDDLCDATGLNRSSLYGSFGDKRALLMLTIDRYSQQGPARLAGLLNQAASLREGMTNVLDEFVERIMNGPGRTGCFIGNCAIELARHDRQALQLVRQAMQNTETVLRSAFTRAQQRGELSKQCDPTALARFFVAGIQGLRLVGKTNPERKTLDDICTTMLSLLD